MKSNYLLSNKFKKPGWILMIFGLLLGIYMFTLNVLPDFFIVKVLAFYNENSFLVSTDGFFKIIDNNILDEIALLAMIIGGLFVGFSKEKVEDEFIYNLRNKSLVWAIVFNYIVLSLSIIFIYGFSFVSIVFYNMFTPLLFFIIRFNYLKARA